MSLWYISPNLNIKYKYNEHNEKIFDKTWGLHNLNIHWYFFFFTENVFPDIEYFMFCVVWSCLCMCKCIWSFIGRYRLYVILSDSYLKIKLSTFALLLPLNSISNWNLRSIISQFPNCTHSTKIAAEILHVFLDYTSIFLIWDYSGFSTSWININIHKRSQNIPTDDVFIWTKKKNQYRHAMSKFFFF